MPDLRIFTQPALPSANPCTTRNAVLERVTTVTYELLATRSIQGGQSKALKGAEESRKRQYRKILAHRYKLELLVVAVTHGHEGKHEDRPHLAKHECVLLELIGF